MRYSLLDHLACPACHSPLACITHAESAASMPEGLFPDGSRVSGGPGLGPSPTWTTTTALTALLDRHAAPPAAAERGRQVEVQTGLLVCGSCGRWFPIEGGIPELLPDHLRDAARESALFATAAGSVPREVRDA